MKLYNDLWFIIVMDHMFSQGCNSAEYNVLRGKAIT